MIRVIAASCNTGSWQQKWSCGWHQPANAGIAHAGYVVGRNAVWFVVAVIVVAIFARGRRGHRAASAADARPAPVTRRKAVRGRG